MEDLVDIDVRQLTSAALTHDTWAGHDVARCICCLRFTWVENRLLELLEGAFLLARVIVLIEESLSVHPTIDNSFV
jgi:hypothetical protein